MYDVHQRPTTRSSRAAQDSSVTQLSSARSRNGQSGSGSGRNASPRPGGPRSAPPRLGGNAGGFDRRPLFIVAGAATVLCLVFALASSGDGSVDQAASALAPDTVAITPGAAATNGSVATGAAADPLASVTATTLPAAEPLGAVQDLDGSDLTSADSCLMDKLSVRQGDSGHSVECVQQSLIDAGFYTGSVSGVFDGPTFTAVEAMQADRGLFVDGIVGRESAISLGVWPDEESLVVRTPKPASGAVDLMGYPLSSVASAGSNAPPLPENSGSGRRLVYDRAGQRVWAIDGDGNTVRSWLVSGSKYSNELPGTHEVYSRSDVSTAWNGKAYLPKMVRWLKTDIGAIGFHSIPLHVEDNSPYQTEAELGTRLSGGCQRQAVRDANFLWDFAQVGTTVVVV